MPKRGGHVFMRYQSQRALALLREGTGRPDAAFREGQEHAIRHVVEGGGRLLVVQKTGWGKSFVYFIATKLLRESGAGPALLISPLLALMRNQIAAAERMGVNAVRIASDNRDHWQAVEEQLRRHEVDILLISPERFGNEHFRGTVLAKLAERIAFLVIDEAHCISDWGHDFRPHYRLIERIIRTLPPNLRLLATTATANNRVMDDLRDVLGPNLEVQRGDLARHSCFRQYGCLDRWSGWRGWRSRFPNCPATALSIRSPSVMRTRWRNGCSSGESRQRPTRDRQGATAVRSWSKRYLTTGSRHWWQPPL